MSDYPMLISNKLHSFRNFFMQDYQDALKIDPHNEMAKHNIRELNK